MKRFWFFWLFICFVFSGYSQTYPVNVSVQFSGQNLPYISYYGDQNQHLKILALLTDFNAGTVNVKLRLKLEGPGFTYMTNPNAAILPSFYLNPGEPYFIMGDELLPYLTEENLIPVSGSAPHGLNRLPEGMYQLCVDVIHNNTNQEVLSTNNCQPFFINKILPPTLLSPFDSTVLQTNLQMQTFTWTPPLNYTPDISTQLHYRFYLYEMVDPNNLSIFETGQGLMDSSEVIGNMRVLQIPFDAFLNEGYKYAWRVRAWIEDAQTGQDLNIIEQNGFSPPYFFRYGQATDPIASLSEGLHINLSTNAQGERSGKAFWTITDDTPGGLSDYTSYIIEYRKKVAMGEPFNWHRDTLVQKNFDIYQLEPEQTYEVRVSGRVNNYQSEPSEISEFTTPPRTVYACNAVNMPYLSQNFQPLLTAYSGMIFQIGQFELEVLSIQSTGSQGHFRGYGLIQHDFLSGAKARVKFDDILVDNQYIVRQGTAQALTQGADAWVNDHYLDMVEPYVVNGTISAYGFVNDTTAFVVVNGDTLTFNFTDPDLPIVVHGDNNVEIQFWPDGTIVVTTYGVSPSADSLDATPDFHVQFKATGGEELYFDQKEYDQFALNYEVIQCASNYNYWVSNVSKTSTDTRTVLATVHANVNGYTASELSFAIKGGATLTSTQLNDTTFQVQLPARTYPYQVYAYYDSLKLGKLQVVTLETKQRKVHLVPLQAYTGSETTLETALNAIFAPSQVELDVVIDSVFTTPEFTSSTTFDNPDVSGMQHYTEQMRALRDAYKETHDLSANDYLVFVIPGFTNPDIDGYMVRGKGLGFVKANSNATEFAHTLAHELGHGMGGLQHAWGENITQQGTTNNLMDYSSGTRLTRNQWQALNEASNVISLFDSEEEAENFIVQSGDLSIIYSSFPNADGTISFMDPSGGYITLPTGVKSLTFASPDSYWVSTDNEKSDFNKTPIGALLSFTLANDSVYHSTKRTSDDTFLGYYRSVAGQKIRYNAPATTPAQINYILGGIPVIVSSAVKFKIIPLDKAGIISNGTTATEVGGRNIPHLKFALINEYITSSSSASGQLVLASYQGGITYQELNYLSNIKSTIEGKDAVYAFELAYLLKKNPIYTSCFTSIVNSTNTTIQNAILDERALEEQEFINQMQVPVSDQTNVDIQQMYLSASTAQGTNVTYLDVMVDPDYFKELFNATYNWLTVLHRLQNITKDVLTEENTDIGSLSDQFFYHTTKEQRLCYLSKIGAKLRVDLLKEAGEWTWGNNKESLLTELIISTPEQQIEQVLDALGDNNYLLLRNLDADLWYGQNFVLYSTVSKWITKQRKLNDLYINQAYLNSSNSNYKNPDGLWTLSLRTNSPQFTQSVDWSYYGDSLHFVIELFNNGVKTVKNLFISPYDPVIMVVEENFTFAGMNGKLLQANDKFVVPALFAYWLFKEKSKIATIQMAREVFDAIAVVAATCTANPGPILIVDGIAAGIDLVFAESETYILTQGTETQKELLSSWNNLTLAIGALNGVVGITKGIDNFITFRVDRQKVRSLVASYENDITRLDEIQTLLRSIYKNSNSNLFQRGYTNLKNELKLVLRETELARAAGSSSTLSLEVQLTGDQNLAQLIVGQESHNLAYLDVDFNGKVVYTEMNFIEATSAEIDEVVLVVDGANIKKANGTIVYDKKFTIVKTKTGVIRVVIGEVGQSVISSSQNLFQLNWTNNVTGYLSNTNAQAFWNKTDKLFNHYVEGNYYIKFDPETGDLLFGNIQDQKILGFYEGQMNIDIINNVGGINKIFPFLKEVHGVEGCRNMITLSINGISLYRNTNKTTIALGSYIEGTKEMIEDQLKLLKGSDFGSGPGRIQLLNIDDNIVLTHGGWDAFRTTYNFPYLDLGIINPNKFEFAFITQPTIENVFKINNLGEELLTGYGEEIKYLLEHGVTNVQFNGQTISIRSLIENTNNLKDKLLGTGVYQGQTVYLNLTW